MASSTITSLENVPGPMETLLMKLPQNLKPTKQKQEKSNVKSKVRLDPSRALEPARKKISTPEAQRVMTVFEETIKKVEIVTILPYVIANLDRFGIALGSELVELLKRHHVTHESYEEIRNQLDKSTSGKRKKSGKSRGGKSTPDDAESMDSRASSASSMRSVSTTDSRTENMMRNLSLVAEQLSQSCKNILRSFACNPTALNRVLADESNRSEDCRTLVTTLTGLRDILLGKLLTTPSEQKDQLTYLQEISQRERQNALAIGKLETELESAEDDKDSEIKKKNDIIRRLQSDLHQIDKFSEENIRRVKSEADKQEAADLKNSDGRKTKLVQEVNQLRTQHQNLVAEHRENEQVFRKKKFKIETEVENWIQKYDQDMGDRQDEYEEIDNIYTEEKKQLNELEERFQTLETEYTTIMEERKIARERQEAAERELAIMIKAATTIQAYFRSYKVRKALKAKKKKVPTATLR